MLHKKLTLKRYETPLIQCHQSHGKTNVQAEVRNKN